MYLLKTKHRPGLSLGVVIVMLLAVVAGFIIWRSSASSPLVASEPDQAVVSAPATVNTDTTASAGKAIKFAASGPCGQLATAPTYKHIIWIWEENKDAAVVNGAAPYINVLGSQCARLTNVLDNATTIGLPSEPQYAAAISGSNCNVGITSSDSDGSGCIKNDQDGTQGNQLTTVSLFQLVKNSGRTWKSYQEGMQSSCSQTSSAANKYYFKHNPAAFYTQIRSDCNRFDIAIPSITCSTLANGSCSTPTGALADDIRTGALPTFAFITPNIINDMHDGEATTAVRTGDNWLKTYMKLILNGPNYRAGDTAIFIMWDEGSAGSGTAQAIPSLVVAPSIRTATTITTAVNNISLLRTTQDILGLTPYLGCASGTPPGGVGHCNPGSNVSLKRQLNL